MRRVVITGMGTINPLANNVVDFWDALKKGKSGAGNITQFDVSKFKTRFASEVKGYDPMEHFTKPEARKFDRYTQLAIVSATEAVEQSKLMDSEHDSERIGVIWASGNGGISTLEYEMTNFTLGDGTPRFNPFLVPKMIINIAAGLISIKYGFKGVNFATVSACTASNNAIMDAFNYIRWNKADVMVAGGSEAAVTPSSMGGFGAMRALSTNNDNPTGASRPFDKNRDGFVLAEGGGALVLEEYEHAMARNAPIYGEILGAAMTSDAYHLTATHPEGDGAYRAMKLAMEEAGVTINDIDYVNAHATSTPVGDASELIAMGRVLEGTDKTIDVSATKSMTGHLLGGAGVVESIACLKAMEEGIIPPTINLEEPDEIPANINIIANKAQAKDIKICLNNTSGFGGHNAMLVFKKWEG